MPFVSWLLLDASPRALRSFPHRPLCLHTCNSTVVHGCGRASILLTTLSAKTKHTYTSASAQGGQWTIALLVLCTLLTITELRTWWSGEEMHYFSVERG